MAGWNDLPHEIRIQILQQFCTDLIVDFALVEKQGRNYISPGAPIPINQLQAPQYLTSFASAIRTCHYFHDLLTHVIKVDGTAPAEILQEIQRRIIRTIWLEVNVRGGKHDRRTLDFEEIYAVAGCFWRNKKFFDSRNYELIGKLVIYCLNPRSRALLVPHLEAWLHALAQESYLAGEVIVTEDSGQDGFPKPEFRLYLGDRAILGYDFICAIVAEIQLLNGHGIIAKESHKDEWWLFLPSGGYCEYDGLTLWSGEWTLVNYRRRLMYDGNDGKPSHSWKDLWDVFRL